jgi:hypothetical protein
MAGCKNCQEGTVNNEGEVCKKCKRQGVSFSTSSSQIEEEKLGTIEPTEESEEETTESTDGLNEETNKELTEEIFRQLEEMDGWHLSLSNEIKKVEEQIKNLSGLINDKISLTISQRWVEIAEKAVESKIKDANGKLEVKILPSLGLLENEVKNLSRNLLSQSLSRPSSSSSTKIDLTELKREIEGVKNKLEIDIKNAENKTTGEISNSENRIIENSVSETKIELIVSKELKTISEKLPADLSEKIRKLCDTVNANDIRLNELKRQTENILTRVRSIDDEMTKIKREIPKQTQAIRESIWENEPSNFWNVVNFFLIIGGFGTLIYHHFFRKKTEETRSTPFQEKNPKKVSFW